MAAAILSTLCGFFFGYDTGILTYAKNNLFSDLNIHTPNKMGTILAAIMFGGLLGAILSYPITRFLPSRKISLRLTFAIHLAGVLLAYFSNNMYSIIAARLLIGIAIGLYSMMVPMYVAEISSTAHRGKNIFCLPFGITLGLLVGMLLSASYSTHWRTLILLNVVWISLAAAILFKLRNSKTIRVSKNTDKTRSDIWIFCLLLACLQQFTGINVINMFAPEILGSAELYYFLTNALFGVIGIMLIDRMGRRTLMMTSLIGMSLSLAGLGFGLGWPFALLYIASFSIGMSGPPYIMPSELFIGQQRERGIMMVNVTSFGCNALITFAFPQLITQIGVSHSMWVFSMSCILGLIFIFSMAPETRGLSLDKIEQKLRGRNSLRTMGVDS